MRLVRVLPPPFALSLPLNPPSRINLNVWRPSNGTWYVNPAISPGPIPIVKQWGLPGDIPVAGDFNGDGQLAYAVWRPSEGNWYVSFVIQRDRPAHASMGARGRHSGAWRLRCRRKE